MLSLRKLKKISLFFVMLSIFLPSCQQVDQKNAALVATDVLVELKADSKLGVIVSSLLDNGVLDIEILNLGSCLQLQGIEGVGSPYLTDLTDKILTCAEDINFSITGLDRLSLLLNKALTVNAFSYITANSGEFEQKDDIQKVYQKFGEVLVKNIQSLQPENLSQAMEQLTLDVLTSFNPNAALSFSLFNIDTIRSDAVVGLAQGFIRGFSSEDPTELTSFVEDIFLSFKKTSDTYPDLFSDKDVVTQFALGVVEEIKAKGLETNELNTISQTIISQAVSLSDNAQIAEIKSAVQKELAIINLDDFAVSIEGLPAKNAIPETDKSSLTFVLIGQYATHFSLSTSETCTTSSWKGFPSNGKMAYTLDGDKGLRKFYFQAKRDTGDGSEKISACVTVSLNYSPARIVTFSNALSAEECNSVNGYWQNNACTAPSIASATTAEECHVQLGFWYDSSCHNDGITCAVNSGLKAIVGNSESCDTITLANAESAEECHAVNSYWYNSTCNSSVITCAESSLLTTIPGNGESCQALTIANSTTSSQCSLVSGFWNGTSCLAQTIANASTSSECSIVNGFWHTNTCVAQTIANAIDSTECSAVSGYWYSSACNPIASGASISIAAGAAATSSSTVAVALAATGAAEMYITNTAGCASGGSWQTYASSLSSWNLAQTNATATVYVKFRNSSNDESSCLSDTIVHDTVAPGDPGSFSYAGAVSAEQTPSMTWTAASDSGSGIAHYEIAVGSSAGETNILDWTSVGNVTSHQESLTGLLTASNTYYVSIRAVDSAGNTSSVVQGGGFTYAGWAGSKLLGVSGATTRAYGITRDSSGNIIITGETSGNLSGQTRAGSIDMFVAKYNGGGALQWVRLLGVSSKETRGYEVASDASGNIYVAGTTTGGVDGNTLTGTQDVFLIKYNSSGTKQWTKQLGSTGVASGCDGNGNAASVAVDSAGIVYVTSCVAAGTFDGTSVSASKAGYVMAYDGTGTKQWKSIIGSSGFTYTAGVRADSSNNVYVSGFTSDNLDGNTKTGSSDLFVKKFNSSGTAQWTRLLGASGLVAYVEGFAVDSSGNSFVVGQTDVGLDGNTLVGAYDYYITMYNTSGTKQWTKQNGSASGSSGKGAAVDASGNVFMVGSTYGNLYATSAGGVDMVAVKYNSSGVVQWGKQIGSVATDRALAAVVDSSGAVYVTGFVSGTFDGVSLTGSEGAVIVKYDASGTKQ